ncbi:MAG: response regulator [Candidatus Gastranaerophilaceae bacterium]|jgi:CheY-like chemotaxis protein
MSDEKISVEVDRIFLETFFGIADMPAPANVTKDDMISVVGKIKEKMSTLALSMSTVKPAPAYTSDVATTSIQNENSSNRLKTVLVVDDLGVITYQIETMLKKQGFKVTISNDIHDAIEKYKKQDFGYAIIDLFIPTEREGFMLLDELKKLALLCQLNTKIIVMTASSKEEFKVNCTNRGADCYLEKTVGWQQELLQACIA